MQPLSVSTSQETRTLVSDTVEFSGARSALEAVRLISSLPSLRHLALSNNFVREVSHGSRDAPGSFWSKYDCLVGFSRFVVSSPFRWRLATLPENRRGASAVRREGLPYEPWSELVYW